MLGGLVNYTVPQYSFTKNSEPVIPSREVLETGVHVKAGEHGIQMAQNLSLGVRTGIYGVRARAEFLLALERLQYCFR